MRYRYLMFMSICLCLQGWLLAEETFWEGWKEVRKEAVTLFCRPGDETFGTRVLDIIDETCPKVVSGLGLFSCPSVTIIIASSELEFNALTQGQIPEWGIAAADPSQSVIFLKSPRFSNSSSNLREIVVHELSHVVLHQAVGHRRIPRWLDEGFAQSQAHESRYYGMVLLARHVVAGRLLALEDIDYVLTYNRDKAQLAYQMSLSVMQFLHESCGPDGIIPVIQTIKRGGSLDSAIRSGTGLSMREFEKAWAEDVKKTYVWYIFIDFPVLFGLIIIVLFISALFVRHRKNKFRLREWALEAEIVRHEESAQ